MKKKVLFIVFLVILMVVSTGAIYASKNEAVNNIDTGVVNIEIHEYTLNEDGEEVLWKNGVNVLPGMVVSKRPYFKATGNDCYIRAIIDVEEDIQLENEITSDNFKGISDDWVKVGDYYYYKNILKTNDSVLFFENFEVPDEWGNEVNPDNIGDWGFSVNVTVDAVQSDNFSPDFESSNPWGDLVVKESIHKNGYDINIFTNSSETDMFVIIEDPDNIVVKPEDFFKGFKTMVPGDIMSDSVVIDCKDRSEVFFSTESLTDIELLKNMYLKITLVKGGKDKQIYDGVLDSDLNNISLGKFKKGEKAEMLFKVYMPEHLDNEYTLRSASVKWSFSAEKINILGVPKTGYNDSTLVFLVVVMVVCVSLSIFLLGVKRKKNGGKS